MRTLGRGLELRGRAALELLSLFDNVERYYFGNEFEVFVLRNELAVEMNTHVDGCAREKTIVVSGAHQGELNTGKNGCGAPSYLC